MNEWLDFLSVVGATFWRGFPYDIFLLWILFWGYTKIENSKFSIFIVLSIMVMVILITVNLIIATVPAWFQGTTW
jgi:hypothetical protein